MVRVLWSQVADAALRWDLLSSCWRQNNVCQWESRHESNRPDQKPDIESPRAKVAACISFSRILIARLQAVWQHTSCQVLPSSRMSAQDNADISLAGTSPSCVSGRPDLQTSKDMDQVRRPHFLLVHMVRSVPAKPEVAAACGHAVMRTCCEHALRQNAFWPTRVCVTPPAVIAKSTG